MNDFSFSQSSLQDFVDCPRRFELRYQLKVRWPGFIPDEPEEARKSVILGNRFHLLCQQFFTGVPEELIRQSIDDEILLEWWNNFFSWQQENLLEGQMYPEITLHTRLADQQVVAKFDLLQVHNTGIRIYDWKTSPTRHPVSWLNRKIQTILYPLVLCLAGENLTANLSHPSPESIEMIYWFSSHPQDPETLTYSRYQLDEGLFSIENIIHEIARLSPGDFVMTEDERRCRFCTYRSLCQRHPVLAPNEMDEEISFENALENMAAALESQMDETIEL